MTEPYSVFPPNRKPEIRMPMAAAMRFTLDLKLGRVQKA